MPKQLKVYFDIDVIGEKKFGMTIATIELMRALKAQGVKVTNFVSGRKKHLVAHIKEMEKEGFNVHSCPIPKRALNFLKLFHIDLEQLFIKNFDYFIQVGLHTKRSIPRNKYLIFIHDTVGLRFPNLEPPFPSNSQKIINKVAKIFTVSEFSKSEILSFFKINPTSILVIPNGVDSKKFHEYDKKHIELIKQKYGIRNKYFITYGGKPPRKNLQFLIDTYSSWCGPDKPTLVLFGGATNTTDKKIISLGYLPDEDVPIILAGAEALVFPSYYEGFGLPIVEAFACGVPVICSNKSSLPEVAKGNALLFDPYNKDDLIRTLNYALDNPVDLKKMSIKGVELAKTYSWKLAAENLLKCLTIK